MKAALAPGTPRPWFIYGLNVYTPRIKEILEQWPRHGFDTATMVSEFAPGREARPRGYQDYWTVIRTHPRSVLGGAVYVWFADGPEKGDRAFGLVDSAGHHLDGSLATIGALFQADLLLESDARQPTTIESSVETCSQRRTC
jgi:hypothetical protein